MRRGGHETVRSRQGSSRSALSTRRATTAALAAAKPGDYGDDLAALPCGSRARAHAGIDPRQPAMKARALRIADALLKALDGRGYKLDPGSRYDPT